VFFSGPFDGDVIIATKESKSSQMG
jgi:hypothetical protein